MSFSLCVNLVYKYLQVYGLDLIYTNVFVTVFQSRQTVSKVPEEYLIDVLHSLIWTSVLLRLPFPKE